MHDINWGFFSICEDLSALDSKLLHSSSHAAFLEAFFFECARFFCRGITDISVGLDLIVFCRIK